MRITFVVIPALLAGMGFSQSPKSVGPSIQDRARSFLEESLKDKNPDTRQHAVQALGLVSASEPYLTELEEMLNDKDVEVRLATITSLVDLNSKRTLPALRKAFDSEVPEVSFAAARPSALDIQQVPLPTWSSLVILLVLMVVKCRWPRTAR